MADAKAAMVSPGDGHSCAIARSGSVLCWGANSSGQLGDGTNVQSVKPVVVPMFVPEDVPVAAVESGGSHSCALLLDGSVACWGENGAGQLGDGTTGDSSSPVFAAGVTNAVKLAAGLDFTCALIADGSVECWGEGSGGQLGDGNATDSLAPVAVSGLANAGDIAAGDSHVCVIASGSVRCWGVNTSGQIGDGSTTQADSPTTVSGVSGAAQLSAGAAHSCAVTAVNVKCWGANASGQLGDGTTTSPRTTAVTVGGLTNPSKVAAGAAHSCATDSTPAVKCWGAGASGQLGNGGNAQSSVPVTVNGVTAATSLDAGANHTCLLDDGGSFRCWGAGASGRLGNGATSDQNTPAAVLATAGGKLIAAGASHSCAALSGGMVNCWGYNNGGQLGDGSLGTATAPVVSWLLSNLSSITAGTTHSCAVETGGQAKCWGSNSSLQLGRNSSSPSYDYYAANVYNLTNAVAVDAGSNFTCALTTTGSLRCWGQGGNYQLGNGSNSNSSQPVTVSGVTNATAMTAGGSTACAIVSGGQAKCWGNNSSGQVGQGNTDSPVTAPANVSGVTTATAIANGANHSCAILADTSVKCWGDNTYGQVGDGTTTTPRSTPQAVTGLTGVTSIAVGDYHTCAIAALGAVKCWGNGANGRLGNSGTSNSSSPVDTGVLGATGIAAGGQHSCAIVASGRTYCWGYGLQGALGNGLTSDRTSPYEAEKVLEGLVTISTPAQGSFTQDTTPSIDFSTLDVISPMLQCDLDYSGWNSCGFPPYTPGSPLSVGRHTMRIRAAPDFGGGDVISYTNLSFAVSVVLPTATISSPAEGAVTGDSTPSVTFTATGEGALTVECRADSGAWTACSSPWSPGSTLADGAHSLQVRVTDANTNVATAAVNVTVDTTAPDTSITANPPLLSNSSTPSFSFTASEGGSTFQCRLDAGAWNACSSPHGLSGVTGGSRTFQVRATDQAGNTDATPASYTWTVDLIAPNTTIDSNPANPTNTAASSFSFDATETATFECRLDGGAFSSCASPHSYTPLADGSHTFEVRATDAAGNVDATPASHTWTIDTTPPDTSISANPPSLTNSTAASFGFAATETATYECQIDGGGYSSCSSPRNFSSLSEGPHSFQVRATDAAGNVDATPASHAWTIDTTPPDTSISANPPSLTNSTEASFSFDATETATYECQIDGGGYSSCSSPRNYSSLSDGSHTFQVRATDTAGNVDATPASHTWTIDTSPPDTSITANPAAPSTSADASFSFTATETATFECQIDGGGFGPCASPRDYTSLSDASHTFVVRAIDSAGNVDATPASFTWTIDTTPPDTSITSNPSNPTNSTSATFSFTATETATFECRIDGGGFASCASPRNHSPLSGGSHTFEVRAIDSAGNVDATPASFTWTIDATPPDTSITSNPSNPTNSTSASFSFNATETSTYECRLDGGGYGGCTSPRNYTTLAPGSHTFMVRAIDAAGNIDPTPASFTWTVDLTAPDTTIDSSPPAPSNSASAAFSFSATETSTYECRLDAGGWSACVSPHNLSSLSDASHTFYVRAIDAAGNVDASPASYTWTVDASVPDTSITAAPPSASASAAASFSFSATEWAVFECRLDGGSWESCTSPKSHSGLADGSHTFEVRATDAAANTDPTPATYSWTIDTVAPNTTITAGPPEIENSADASFSFNATEVATFECRLDGEAWDDCVSPKGFASLSEGSHTFDVRAMDAAGNYDPTPATQSWTVDTVAPDTSIGSGPSALTNSTSAAFTFSGADAASFECRLDDGAWSACSSPKNYSGLTDGSHDFEVRATDAAGNTDPTPAGHGWSVDTLAPDTSITAAPAAATNSTGASFSFSATETSAFECQLDGGGYGGCTSPRDYSSLAPGSHTFMVRAIDGAGNIDATPASFSWTIDLTAPDTTIDSSPPVLSNSTSAAFSFSATETSTYECRLDAGGWSACVSPHNLSSLSDASHTFYVRAIDAAGNVDATPATHTWTVDAIVPDTSITAAPPSASASASASFSFNATELALFECRLDGGAWSSCTSPKSYSGLADGSHTFEVRATDSAANTDPTPAAHTWAIDATAPSAQIVSPADGATLGDSTPEVVFTAGDANGVATECSVDAGAWSACSSPFVTPALDDGPHGVSVRATDTFGNQLTVGVDFTIDSTYPTVDIASPANGATLTTSAATVTFAATGNSVTSQCAVDGGAYAACASGDAFGPLADGTHTISVRVTDSLSREALDSVTFSVDTPDPPPPPAPPAPPSEPPPPAAPAAYKPTMTLKKKGGRLTMTLKLTPPAGVAAACSGTVRFSGTPKAARLKGKAALKASGTACVAKRVAKVSRRLKGRIKLTARHPGSGQIAPVKATKKFKIR